MDYICAKFGHCTFSRFGFIALKYVVEFFDPVTLTFDLLTYYSLVGEVS